MSLNVLDDSLVSQVISTVNSLVYNNDSGNNAEIDNNLKTKLKTAFCDFFGEQHKDKISQRIDNMDINKSFHILGSKNSISQFLLDERTNVYNKDQKYPLKDADQLGYYALVPIEQILEYADINEYSAQRLEEVCRHVGFSKDHLKTPNGRVTFKSLVEAAYSKYNNTPYSLDAKKNEQMLFLQEYTESYKDYLQKKLAPYGQDVFLAMNDPDQIFESDPVFQKLTEHMPAHVAYWCAQDLCLPTSSTAAFQYMGDIYLGINPNSSVIVHEVFHRVVENETTKNTGIQQEEGQRYFNEVITEFYSQAIHRRLVSTEGKNLTINNNDFYSSYEDMLFEYMTPFMKTFGPEFKEALMTDNPVESMKKLIGEQQFDKIAGCCDTIYRYGHDANCIQIENRLARDELTSVAESTRIRKSPLERVFNAISRNAEEVANRINSKDFPHLQKLAGGIYSMSDFINQHTQQKVRDSLENSRPTMNWNPPNSNQSVDTMDNENDIVMEMKNPNYQ